MKSPLQWLASRLHVPCGNCLAPLKLSSVSDDAFLECPSCEFQCNLVRVHAFSNPAQIDKSAVSEIVPTRTVHDELQFHFRQSDPAGILAAFFGLAILAMFLGAPTLIFFVFLLLGHPAGWLFPVPFCLGAWIAWSLLKSGLSEINSKSDVSCTREAIFFRSSSMAGKVSKQIPVADIESVSIARHFKGSLLEKRYYKYSVFVHTFSLKAIELSKGRTLEEAVGLERVIENYYGLSDNPAFDWDASGDQRQ